MKLEKNQLIEKLINILLNLLIFIFGVILLISVYTGVQRRILGRDYSDFFGYSVFEVQTGSMEKAISPGDWIIVKLTQDVELKEIITYKLDGQYVTHRVIEAYNGTYITMGDANNSKDKPIDKSQIIGKVVKIIPNFGILRKTMFNPAVLIMLMVTLFLFNFAFIKNKEVVDKYEKGLVFDSLIRKVSMILGNVLSKIIEFLEKRKENIKVKNPKKEQIKKEIKLKEEVLEVVKPEENNSENDETDKKYTEEELEKTSLFRMVSVGSNEAPASYKEIKEAFEKEETKKVYTEDELEKTSLFRIISVDTAKADQTLVEIAENELNERNRLEKLRMKEVDKVEETSAVVEEETLTSIELELLKNNKKIKKGKNIIDSVMNVKKEELKDLLENLINNSKISSSRSKDDFIENYLNVRYFNLTTSKDLESGKISLIKIKKVVNDTAVSLVKLYKGKDTKYNEVISTLTSAFLLIATLDLAQEAVSEMKVKREFYKKEILKFNKNIEEKELNELIINVMDIQKRYDALVKYILKKLETNMFELIETPVRKNLSALKLEHNISFSRVYSDYIIDKTYKEGIIAEDKMAILLTMLSVKIAKDVLASELNKKYIIYVPSSLYDKEKKYEKLLNMIEDEYTKENTLILVKYSDLVNNKLMIKRFRKLGYRYTLLVEKNTNIKEKDKNSMYLVDCIFIEKKDPNLSLIPNDLKPFIIYDDIITKIGGFGGEE